MPPVRRLPPILWLRIKNHLRQYIVEKEADDIKVLVWYHSRFEKVILTNFKDKNLGYFCKKCQN